MSMELTALMLDHGPADALAKLVGLALSDRADEHGVCWPSRADLCQRTGVSYATVSRKLRVLEVLGYIQRRQRRDASTVFRLNVLKLRQAKAEALARKALVVPGGFEPFPEELAAAPLPQALVRVGEVHSDRGEVHSDRGEVHSERVTYQQPINEPSRVRAERGAGRAPRGPRPAPRCAEPVAAPSRGWPDRPVLGDPRWPEVSHGFHPDRWRMMCEQAERGELVELPCRVAVLTPQEFVRRLSIED